MMNSSTDERRDDAVVEATALDVSRGKNAILHSLDFTVRRGSVVGLMGPSGSGKTTLMRAIVGVQQIGGGTLTVLGADAGAAQNRGRIGYVTQAASVYRDLTARANVEYFTAVQGASRSEVNEALTAVDLADYADRPVETLSGGQASRVSLACALVGSPDLLVLDEPTVGLDPVTREGIWQHLRQLADDGATLIVSSHVMDEANHCDDLLLLRDGRVLAQLTPAELLRRTGEHSMDDAFLALIRKADR